MDDQLREIGLSEGLSALTTSVEAVARFERAAHEVTREAPGAVFDALADTLRTRTPGGARIRSMPSSKKLWTRRA